MVKKMENVIKRIKETIHKYVGTYDIVENTQIDSANPYYFISMDISAREYADLRDELYALDFDEIEIDIRHSGTCCYMLVISEWHVLYDFLDLDSIIEYKLKSLPEMKKLYNSLYRELSYLYIEVYLRETSSPDELMFKFTDHTEVEQSALNTIRTILTAYNIDNYELLASGNMAVLYIRDVY